MNPAADDTKTNVDKQMSSLMLITTEVAEAAEDVRVGRLATTLSESGKPVGIGSELADIIIRTLDFAERLGLNMDDEVELKLEHNTRRTFRHGGKKI